MLRFWQALERVPGLATVTAEWRSLLGSEYETGKGFLRPRIAAALSYPCPLPGGCGCAHAVIEHAPGDIVAVCQCEPRRCEAVRLSRADIVLYELNHQALGAAVAAALRFAHKPEPVARVPRTRRIGECSPCAGYRFPVFLTVQMEPEDFRETVDGLMARNDSPFILLAPTQDLCTPACEELLRKRNACLLALADILVLQDASLTAARPVAETLAGFLAAVLPKPADGSCIAFFPTPAGATWADVSIRFRDGHTVSVKVKDVAGVFNYTQMGMSNLRNSEPTVRWKLLRTFAKGRGVLHWGSRDADRKNQKRREVLAENLRAFFRIEGAPFRLTNDRKGWEARFSISPDE